MVLHHIGIAVRDIEREVGRYVDNLGYEVVSQVIHDPVQTAYVCFLKLAGDPVYLELVAPDSEQSKLARALAQGGGLNHLCYVTADIGSRCVRMRKSGMFVIQEPVAAVAFPGRRIAWLMGRSRIPVELVEAGTDQWERPK